MRIGIVSGYGWAHISMPIFSTVTHLRNAGHELFVFFEKSSHCSSLGLNDNFFDYENVNVIEYSSEDLNKEYGSFTNVIAEDIDMFCANFILSHHIKFDIVIGYEPRGLIRGALIKSKINCKLVYFSLEILDSNSDLKKAEIHYSKEADIIMIQDNFRADIISKLNNYDRNKIYSVYNTTLGDPYTQKSSFLRETFKIPDNKIILLAAGSIMRSTGLYELLNIANECANKIAIVFHGWMPYSKDKMHFEKAQNKFAETIFLSEKLFSHKEKFKVHASADVGFIYYEPRDINYKYAAWSSGKFFDFMRCGIPVLCKMMLNAQSLVLDNKCGLIYSNPNEICHNALGLGRNKNNYMSACFKTFEKYSFAESFNNAWKHVIQDSHTSASRKHNMI